MIKNKLKKLLADLRGFEFVKTLAVSIKKENDDERKYSTFYWNWNAEIIINDSDTNDTFESVYADIIS